MTVTRLTSRHSRWHVVLFGILAYVPGLATKPGRMVADTKLYLYLDPGRLMSDAPFTWDTRQFGGWVPHQTIAYLWPQGPWYWAFDKLAVPDWIAHRLWIGTLLFAGALGVYWLARLLGLPKSGAAVAAVVYQLSPYTLPYLSRTSAMLLPWAALGWLIGLTILAATRTGRWKYPALIGLVLATCSAVNATAVLMIAPAPILWLAYAATTRTVTWRRAAGVALRIGVLSVGVSLWWMVMLRTQGAYGADVLQYSESLQATSLTSTSTEVLRGMGYWLFYFRDPYAYATTAAKSYLESSVAIGLSFLLLIVCIAGIALTRWTQRGYAALLIFVGTVLAVGVHPIARPSPLMAPIAADTRNTFALALRSSTRAIPMSTLGLALGAGGLVAALLSSRVRVRAVAPLLVISLAIVNLPALFDGNLIDPGLERDQSPPAAWQQAAGRLSNSSAEYRVLQMPGQEFGAFRWGYTADPPLPGMTTKPLITRDLLPLGSPGVMDLLVALDDRIQANTLDTAAIAVVARYLGADTIWLANDLAFDRFRTPRPENFARLFETPPPGLGAATSFGEPSPNLPDLAMIDEIALSSPNLGEPVAPVALVPVSDPVPIVRVGGRAIVLAGSGDGVVDAAAAGLLRGDEALLYAADAIATVPGGVSAIIITDSNRDRARHWGTSQDVTGFTESGGDRNDVLRLNERDVRLPVFGATNVAADQTVAFLDSGLVVRASGYGEAYAYRPEQRPAMAVDGDPTTAWIVGDRDEPLGHFLTVSRTGGTLQLLQPQGTNANRVISTVRITPAGGATTDVVLDDRSLSAPGQLIEVPSDTPLTITITGVTKRAEGTDVGPSGVGFAELGLGRHTEIVRTPISGIDSAADTPVAVVLTRLRVDPRNRWRSDPERSMQREFLLPAAHDFELSVVLRRNDRAPDDVLAALEQVAGARASDRLTGVPSAAGRFAVDGDIETAWTSPFGDGGPYTLTVPLTGEPFSLVSLRQVVDERHSLITDVRAVVGSMAVDLVVPPPDSTGTSTLELPTAVSGDTLTLEITGVAQRTTIDRRYVEATTLPVAISELAGPPIAPPTELGKVAERCDATLVEIDGAQVPLRLTVADQRALAAGESIRVGTCEGARLSLAAGRHRISTPVGRETGVDVNQIVLDDGVGALASDAQRRPEIEVERTRTTRVAHLQSCPSGCWLILGEGFNVGWSAHVAGQDLGPPRQIAGGFNGWWLPPFETPQSVTMTWTRQNPVTYALFASLAAILLCAALAFGRRRPAASDATWMPSPPRFSSSLFETSSRRRSLLAALVLVVLATVMISPLMGAVAILFGVGIVWWRRPAVGGVLALLLITGLGAAVTARKLLGGTEAGAPGRARLHGPGLLIVTLLLVGVLFDRWEGRKTPR